eukprot:Clim_evm9s230 gene=Clim_evmTU9s230
MSEERKSHTTKISGTALTSVLRTYGAPLDETQLWSILYGCCLGLLRARLADAWDTTLEQRALYGSMTLVEQINEKFAQISMGEGESGSKEAEKNEDNDGSRDSSSQFPLYKVQYPAECIVTPDRLLLSDGGVITPVPALSGEVTLSCDGAKAQFAAEDFVSFLPEELISCYDEISEGQGIQKPSDATAQFLLDERVLDPSALADGDAASEEHLRRAVAPEALAVFSLGATVFVCADYGLEEDEAASLSEALEGLLEDMTAEVTERCGLLDVLRACTGHLYGSVESASAESPMSKSSQSSSAYVTQIDAMIRDVKEHRAHAVEAAKRAVDMSAAESQAGDPRENLVDPQRAKRETFGLLMAEISSPWKPTLKDASKRELAPAKVQFTPHELLMADIRNLRSQRRGRRVGGVGSVGALDKNSASVRDSNDSAKLKRRAASVGVLNLGQGSGSGGNGSPVSKGSPTRSKRKINFDILSNSFAELNAVRMVSEQIGDENVVMDHVLATPQKAGVTAGRMRRRLARARNRKSLRRRTAGGSTESLRDGASVGGSAPGGGESPGTLSAAGGDSPLRLNGGRSRGGSSAGLFDLSEGRDSSGLLHGEVSVDSMPPVQNLDELHFANVDTGEDLTFAEIRNIESVVARAEIEELSVMQPELVDLIREKEMCARCMTTKFTKTIRAKQCICCALWICTECIGKPQKDMLRNEVVCVMCDGKWYF